MKFDFEPYKLFTVGELKKGIKDNLKGNFTISTAAPTPAPTTVPTALLTKQEFNNTIRLPIKAIFLYFFIFSSLNLFLTF